MDVYNRFSTDAGSFLAASISYYALFSIFPLLLLAISAAGFVLADSTVTDTILDYTKQALPQFSGIVRANVEAISQNRQSTGLIGLLGLIWIGTAVFEALEFAMNQVWKVKAGRHFILSKLLSISAVIGVTLTMIFTTMMSALFEAFQVYWRQSFAAAPPLEAFRATTFLATAIYSFGALVFIYAVTPNIRLGFRDVWVGAAFSVVVLEGAKRLFVLYTSHIARFNAVYGSVGVIVGLLFWLYIMAMIVVLGAEINAALKERRPAL